MRALKVLVVVMGVLIVVGTTVIVVTIIRRATTTAPAPATPAASAVGDLKFPLPPAALVEEQSLEGDRLIVRLRLADGTIRLMVFDVAHGRELGRVDFVPQRQ